MNETEFLEAIEAGPENPVPRLVYPTSGWALLPPISKVVLESESEKMQTCWWSSCEMVVYLSPE